MSGLPAQVAIQLGLDGIGAGPRVVLQEAVVAHHLQIREHPITHYTVERVTQRREQMPSL